MWILLWLMFEIATSKFDPLDPTSITHWPDVIVVAIKALLLIGLLLRIVDLWYYIVKVSRARVEVINNTVGAESGPEK